MSINQRIKHFTESINSNATSLSNEIGVSSTSLLKVLKGENQPSAKILIPLKEKYPLLNMNWVIIGEGQMLLDKGHLTDESKKMTELLEHTVQLQKESLAAKDQRIKDLESK